MNIVSVRDTFLEKELRGLGHTVHSFNSKAKGKDSLVNFVKHLQPDFFYIQKDTHITPEVLRHIKKNNPQTKIIMWFGDQRGRCIVPLIKQRISILHGLLITNEDPQQIKMYKDAGIPFVNTFYHSFSTTEFQLWPTKLPYQVFFGGSNFKSGRRFPLSPIRAQLIKALHTKFKLVVHGNGWPFPTQRWLLRNEYAKALRTAIINVGINHYNVQNYFNRRLFESVASGRLHVTYYIPGMEKYFVNNRHLVWFNSVEQGIDIIQFYLKHTKSREQIARQGRAFFVKNHSWPVRAKQFSMLLQGMK